MEIHYPELSANNLQILLIQKKAKEMGVPASEIEAEWVENFSPLFRDAWDSGERDLDMIEEKLYTPGTQNHFAEVVSKLIVC